MTDRIWLSTRYYRVGDRIKVRCDAPVNDNYEFDWKDAEIRCIHSAEENEEEGVTYACLHFPNLAEKYGHGCDGMWRIDERGDYFYEALPGRPREYSPLLNALRDRTSIDE